MGRDIHDAEHFPCLLNHITDKQQCETAIVPLGGSLLG
jgi:hypothetical protein